MLRARLNRTCARSWIMSSVQCDCCETNLFKYKRLSLKPFSMLHFSLNGKLLYLLLYPDNVKFPMVCKYSS